MNYRWVLGTAVLVIGFGAVALVVGARLGPMGASAPVAQARLTALQKDDVRQVIHDHLLENPEIVYEALQTLQEREVQRGKDEQRRAIARNKDLIFNSPMDAVIGSPDAQIVIAEFYDYHCPYCKGMAESIRLLVEKNPDVRIVLKEFPVLAPESVIAAAASMAARSDPNFAKFHGALLGATGKLTDEAIGKIAQSVGIDYVILKEKMRDPAIEIAVRTNIELGKVIGVTGTPAFVIGDTLVPGAQEPAAMQALVDKARQGG